MAPSRAFPRLLAAPPRAFASAFTTTPKPRSLASGLPRRHYHSHDHPPPPGPFAAPEQRAILSAAYAHVPAHGFSQRALALGARDAGYLDISANIVPDGPFGLIAYHLATKREALAPRSADIFHAAAEVPGPKALGVDDKVERLAWERLLANEAVIHRWQEALAIMAQPTRVPASLRELALLADEIIYLAGDKAVDPTWYTKRGSLSAAYAAAELFMTNDRSAGFAETRAFLRRRLEESGKVGLALGNVAQWVGFTASASVNVLRSKGVRI